MYEVVLRDGEFWIAKDGMVLEVLGSFNDPLTPEIIISEFENEV